jgi:aspartate-semialdehyde dehydrogenase
MKDDAVIILDPVNLPVIQKALAKGGKNWIGGNCTVSCMLMGVGALYKAGLVEWMSTQTYQAASGGGAQHMRELLTQYGTLNAEVKQRCSTTRSRPSSRSTASCCDKQQTLIRSRDRQLRRAAGRLLIPWIDKDLGTTPNGACPRKSGRAAPRPTRSSARARASARHAGRRLLRARRRDALPQPGADLQAQEERAVGRHRAMIANDNAWVKVVPNTREATIRDLTPVAVTGTMTIPVGRIRKLAMGPEYVGAFTIGDQLLWGAAEPLRRMLRILLEPDMVRSAPFET